MRAFNLLALCFALVLLLSITVPVSAAEDDSAWMELLEFSTVNDSGMNTFSYTTSATINIPTPQNMRCCKIDMLLVYSSGTAPRTASVMYNGITYSLTIAQINDTTCRIYGDIPDTMYSNVLVRFTRSASTISYCELLSCRVTSVTYQDAVADAEVQLDGAYYSVSTNIDITGSTPNTHANAMYQALVLVYDWQKFDRLTIWGSVTDASLASVRATLGTVGLPIEVSYINPDAAGGWVHWYGDADSGDSAITDWYGKYLYCITIDLSTVDRTNKQSALLVYLTGNYDTAFGATFLCQYVNGSIVVPDTSNASLWSRFKSFMTDLFVGDTTKSDVYQDEAGHQRDELDDMNQQLDNVTKPAVDGIQMDVDNYLDGDDSKVLSSALGALTGNSLIISMMCICLTIALVGYVLYGKR